MLLPDLLVEMEFVLFMAAVIEVDPRYRRLEMLVVAEEIVGPELVIFRTKLTHHIEDRELPMGEISDALELPGCG